MTPNNNTTVENLVSANGLLTVEGINKLNNDIFFNYSLDQARDLWMLSFSLMGLGIMEIMEIKKEDLFDNFIYLNDTGGTENFIYPLPERAKEIFNKYPGNIYALKPIEENFVPKGEETRRKARKQKIKFNRDMEFIKNLYKLDIDISFDNIHVIWKMIGRQLNLDKKTLHIVSDFVTNMPNRKSINGYLENINNVNNIILGYVFDGIVPETRIKKFPIAIDSSRTLMYED